MRKVSQVTAEVIATTVMINTNVNIPNNVVFPQLDTVCEPF